MGAQQFVVTATGRDAREAFRRVTDEARYMNGHGGYTGTIAEKDTFVMISLPTRTDPWKFAEMAFDAAYAAQAVNYDRKGARRVLSRIPARLRPVAARAGEAIEDKWGPAGCVEVTGSAATKAKAAYGLKGTRQKVFVFFGWASS